MENLSEQLCEVCRVGAPQLSQAELDELASQIPGWEVVDVDAVPQLRKKFSFKNFVLAMEFANKVGELAEQANHHPAITVEWGSTVVCWWTHKINGIHQNDAIMAAKTDALIK